MRPQPDLPPRPSRGERRKERRPRLAGRGRVVLGILLALLFFLLVSLRGIASFYTDFLWFDSVGYGDIWRQVLTTKVLLTFAGGLIFFLLCWSNLLIAERLAPVFRPSNGEEDLIERYHEAIGRRAWMVRLAISVLLALVIGVTLGSYWNEWILFKNRVDFGQRDATFDTDIGFYVFELPFLTGALSWLFSSLFVILLITLLAHVINGGIRFQTQLDRVTPQVKAHISVLLALLALVQAGRYWLARYELTFSTRGTVDGATYTDVQVEQRALYLLIMISLFAVGLFIANIWRRGWILPGMAVGLWVLVYLIAGTAVPAFVQRVRVEPTESARERPYIVNNIEATRQGFGLDDVEEEPYNWTGELDAEVLGQNMGTLSNVRLWNPASIQSNFKSDQQLRPYYEISDVDVDRYDVDGELRPVMIAARDLDVGGIDNPSWEQTHLIYTNGWGAVAATANDKTAAGDPRLLASGIPVKVAPGSGLPELTEPRIYFGENASSYVIVNTEVGRDAASEDAVEGAEGNAGGDGEGDVADEEAAATAEAALTRYTGEDGIEIGAGLTGFVRKAAFSLRFGEVDPLLSGSLLPDSRVLFQRDVRARVEALAPFLALDHDPYLVMVDGRLQYVVDAYTTTANYPNAQRADTEGLDRTSGLAGGNFNYVRNSVKAVVDAYDGTVTLYVVDPEDPIIRAYQKAFPSLFEPASEVPEAVGEHFRYPEDLFTVQTQMWGRYHVSDPTEFYNGQDNWEPPQDTGGQRQSAQGRTDLTANGQRASTDDRYASQYSVMQLPGDEEPQFVVMRPFVTASDGDNDGGQNQLRAFMVADSSPGSFGRLRTFVLDAANAPQGPNLAAEDMQANSRVGAATRSLCTEKNVCTFAPPTLVPVGESILYVQSLLVAGRQNEKQQIEFVIVNYVGPDDSEVAIASSLRGALVEIFGEDVPQGIEDAGAASSTDPEDPPEEGEEPELGTLSEQESQLIDEIVALFDEADALAAEGDQVGWVTKLDEANEKARELQELRAQGSDEAPSDEPAEDEGSGEGGTSNEGSEEPETTTTTTVGT